MGGHSRKKLDLLGQQFGKLTVLGPAENVGGRTVWLCQCSCGRQIEIKTCHLRAGHAHSCGCLESRDPQSALGLTYIDGTCVEMLRARTIRSNNTSGVPGVDWMTRRGRWRASICFKGKRYYLGSYGQFADAVCARRRAEEKLHDKFLYEFDQAAAERQEDS